VIQSQHSPAEVRAPDNLASWYTPGLVDGFGDRLLMFDNTGTDSLELLRFHPPLAAIDGFEDALRDRVHHVGRVPDEAFPMIVAVERFEGDGALALVSTHTQGKRVSALFDRPGPRRGFNPSIVSAIVAQTVRALAVLQSKGDDVVHSAITQDRVVITPEGRICVTEHVLGAALRRLDLSALQLWREFGLVSAPTPSGHVRLDARTDVYQVGVLALELLLGRRLSRPDHVGGIPSLLNQWSDAAVQEGRASAGLRTWLERALQLNGEGYGNAAEACSDLRDMTSESAAAAFEQLPVGDGNAGGTRTPQPVTAPAKPRPVPVNVPAADAAPIEDTPPAVQPAMTLQPQRTASSPLAPALPVRHESVDLSPPAPSDTSPAGEAAHSTRARTGEAIEPPRSMSRSRRVAPWLAAALGVVATVEGLVVVALLTRRPAVPAQLGAAVTAPSLAQAAPPSAAPITQTEAALAGDRERSQAAGALSLIEAAASRQRSGGVRFVTPVELKVLQGESVLGSTADGPIVAPAGTHQLDLINPALGVRVRRDVTFRSGEITTLNITIPPGRISVNARPWAEVLIDNRPVGETPLANILVPIGDHEVVFRHPELGERRQIVTVRTDVATRVSTSFDR
jgi:hypothetical protein